jgi:hypothetical protein
LFRPARGRTRCGLEEGRNDGGRDEPPCTEGGFDPHNESPSIFVAGSMCVSVKDEYSAIPQRRTVLKKPSCLLCSR